MRLRKSMKTKNKIRNKTEKSWTRPVTLLREERQNEKSKTMRWENVIMSHFWSWTAARWHESKCHRVARPILDSMGSYAKNPEHALSADSKEGREAELKWAEDLPMIASSSLTSWMVPKSGDYQCLRVVLR
jgi:hypothetical protein